MITRCTGAAFLTEICAATMRGWLRMISKTARLRFPRGTHHATVDACAWLSRYQRGRIGIRGCWQWDKTSHNHDVRRVFS